MASSDPIECNTDTINTLTDCLRANGLGGGAALPEGSIQYNEGGALTGSSRITYNAIPSEGNLVLDSYGSGPFLFQPRSTFISGRDVNVAVASGAPGGRLNISTVGSSTIGGDVSVGEGFNISNSANGNTQTISHGLPARQLSTIKSELDFATPNGGGNKLTFFEDDSTITNPPVATGFTRNNRPALQPLGGSATLPAVIDRVDELTKLLAQYGLITIVP